MFLMHGALVGEQKKKDYKIITLYCHQNLCQDFWFVLGGWMKK
jgi:hypothetical protein